MILTTKISRINTDNTTLGTTLGTTPTQQQSMQTALQMSAIIITSIILVYMYTRLKFLCRVSRINSNHINYTSHTDNTTFRYHGFCYSFSYTNTAAVD